MKRVNIFKYQLYTIRENMVDSASIEAAFAETHAMGYEENEKIVLLKI